MVVSPLNYPGNKARILNSLNTLFAKDIDIFVDVFCGSGIVGLNAKAKKLILNDKEKHIIDLLRFFQKNSLDFILKETSKIIAKYQLTDSKNKPKGFYEIHKNEGLSRHNKKGFLELRNAYNQAPSEIKLFVLILFGFNHYMRFNSQGFYNVPVGKMDFSKSLYDKTIDFIKLLQSKNLHFSNVDFRENSLYEKGDFFYFDPPYLITNAPYNALWCERDEKDLYEICEFINSKNKRFALSNVLKSNGKSNEMLKKWSVKYNTTLIKRRYANANYQRKNLSESSEVLITNY